MCIIKTYKSVPTTSSKLLDSDLDNEVCFHGDCVEEGSPLMVAGIHTEKMWLLGCVMAGERECFITVSLFSNLSGKIYNTEGNDLTIKFCVFHKINSITV